MKYSAGLGSLDQSIIKHHPVIMSHSQKPELPLEEEKDDIFGRRKIPIKRKHWPLNLIVHLPEIEEPLRIETNTVLRVK